MGVYEEDRYPFLRAEVRLIEEALRRDLPVLGVCLGSQLLAAALGAQVRPGSEPEVGWLAVELEAAAEEDRLFSGLPRRFVAFHWHGDVFDSRPGPPGSPAGSGRPTRPSGMATGRTGCCSTWRWTRPRCRPW